MAGVAAEYEEAVLLWKLAVIPVTLEQFWLVQVQRSAKSLSSPPRGTSDISCQPVFGDR
jgi:hypothetical protein